MAKGNHKPGRHGLRSARSQATHVAIQLAAHGTPRHGAGRDTITNKSIASERIMKGNLAVAAEFAAARGQSLATMTRQLAIEYLEHRAEAVRQSQLNSDRQSLNKLLALKGEMEKLPVITSELSPLKHHKHYSPPQFLAVTERQASAANRLASLVIANAGLRAHETYSLRRLGEGGAAADHRAWDERMFAGRAPDAVYYLTTGKGGLTRIVCLDAPVAEALEQARLPAPVEVVDRGVRYSEVLFSISGGNRWSASWGRASVRALGWSEGGHALRHTFVATRMATLTQELNYSYDDARLICSNELGHFRVDVMAAYGYP